MKERIIAMIPARIGSTRLKIKNLALLDNKPLISYAIDAANESKVFDRIIINSDNTIFNKVAERYKAEFYLRPKRLGGSQIKSDQVVEDFVYNNPCDIIVWVNPIAPLQSSEEIQKIILYFQENNLDTLFTVKKEKVHSMYKNAPLNYSYDEVFAQTQDLEPVVLYVYSLMMWRTKPFIAKIKSEGNAFYTGKIGHFEVDKISGIIVKDKMDLLIAELMILARKKKQNYIVKYDKLFKEVE